MTIYDIAKKAGVSASTVSRVINGKPGIGEATRVRIQKLLDESGFMLNETARGLSLQSTRFIGILIEDIRVPHHTESAYVIEQEMTRHGYTCITFSTGTSSERKADYIRMLSQRRIDGLIMIGSMFAMNEIVEALESTLDDVPVVIANGTLELENGYSVIVDESIGIERAVTSLIEKGRSNIVFMMDVATPSNQHKKNGFVKGLLENGFDEKDIMIQESLGVGISPSESIDRGFRATEAILERFPDVDAVVCATDLLALGCIKKLHKAGISIPDDISVIGFDNSLYGQLVTPSLSTVDNKLGKVSLNAAQLLLCAMEGREVPHTVSLSSELIVRESS